MAANDVDMLKALARIEEKLAVLGRLERSVAQLEEMVRPGEGAPTAPVKQPAARDRAATGSNDEETWLELAEEDVASLLAPFANEQRIKLLKALYLGINESNRLKDFTGLTGGQLYHHLKELALAKFLSRQVRGEYHLSSFGYYAFSAVMILTADLLAEQMDEELAAPEEIGELD